MPVYDPLLDSGELSQDYFKALAFSGPWPEPLKKLHEGRYMTLVPLSAKAHAAALYEANSESKDGKIWAYLPYGPFGEEAYHEWVEEMEAMTDPHFYAVIPKDQEKAQGVLSLMRHDPKNGVIEVGHINYSPLLQKTRAASEAIFLTMRYAFEELGYRRFEWKCDAMNEGSRRAALRFGFTFEGIFRQAAVVKGRNRDTAWFSILDREWPALKLAFMAWLSEQNFNEKGEQIQPLSHLIQAGKNERL